MTRPSRTQRLQSLINAAKASRFELRNEAGTTSAEIFLYGVVGGFWSGFNAADVVRQITQLDVDELIVHLHSPGGSAFEGIAIYNALRNHKASVTIVVDGLAASAASVIAMAGDEVVMGPGTQLMLHDASTLEFGNAADFRETADWLDQQSQNIATIYANRAGGTAADWRAVMLAESWYGADEAVAAKLADRVSTKAGDPPADETIPPEEDPTFDDEDELENLLASLYHYAGRKAAPAPQLQMLGALKPPTASADGQPHQEGAALVDFTTEQVAALCNGVGIPVTADADTITAAVTEALNEHVDDTQTPPEGFQLVSDAALSSLRSQAEAGAAARAQQLTEQRDRAIQAAIGDGRIDPASRESWVTAWNTRPTETAAELQAMPVGRIPVNELGHDVPGQSTADDQLYASVFGDEKKGA